MSRGLGRTFLGALALLVLGPISAAAQSTLTGLVRDESGAVLPGVAVEASSPALIEKTRAVVTDEQGRYRLIDLRPGVYQVVFTLQGFSTIRRENVEVPANLVVTINADLKVGALEESVTVSGQAAQVDVQQASRTQVLGREFLDALPTTRNAMAIGYLAPGVRMATPDIGGRNTGNQPGMRAHGTRAPLGVLQMIDGMTVSTLEGNQLFYFDESSMNEISVTTSGVPAENATGGIRMNSILRDGGNQYTGDVHVNGTSGDWVSDNVSDEQRELGIREGSSVAQVQYFTGALGGPIKQDKLWFIVSARHASSDVTVPNVPLEIETTTGDVLRGVVDSYIRNASVRLTWQATQKQKYAAFVQRVWKRLGGNFAYGQDPRTGTQRDPQNAHNYLAIGKWTMTPSSQWLLEVGHATSVFNWRSTSRDKSLIQEAFTPAWYAGAQKSDTVLWQTADCILQDGCTSWGALADSRTEAGRQHTSLAASYVTGTHNIKMGFNNNMGLNATKVERNADLIQNYVNHRPSTVTVYNTPVDVPGWVDYDMGLFVQDSWTLNRLTLNPGIRVEWYKASVNETSMAAGRFAPARFFEKESPAVYGPDVRGRFSAVYDLFGTGRTALKASFGQYSEQGTAQDYAWIYANAGQRSESRNWFDCDLVRGTSTCSGAALRTNGDDIAQDNEIGPSADANFGSRADRNPAADMVRMTNTEFTASVQHQLTNAIAVNAGYYRRTFGGIVRTDRTNISHADYTSFTIPMPSVSTDPAVVAVLDPNERITVYNLNSAKRGVYGVGLIDDNSEDQSIYNGMELGFSARTSRFQGFGSWTMERNVSVFCSNNDNPNGPGSADLYQGEAVSLGGRFCDQRNYDMPLRSEFKMAGNTTLPYDVSFGAVWMSFPGRERVITYTVPVALFPGGRTNSETIILNEPGSLYYERYTQFDINFRKTMRLPGNKLLTAQVDFFNVLNNNAIWGQINTQGSSLGQITETLQGRTPRLGLTFKF